MPTVTSDELMPKSADAFRTISEVAEWLEIQAHVLRFWESKFTQVKPIKRAGGRRYYRPADMLLLGGIKRLLHDDGLTIKGVQKILREEGMNHVASLSAPLDELSQAGLDSDQDTIDMPDTLPEAPEPKAAENVVLPFSPPRESGDSEPAAAPEPTTAAEPQQATSDEPAADTSEVTKAETPEDLPEPTLPTPPAQFPTDPETPAQRDDEPTPPVAVDQETAPPVTATKQNVPEAEELSETTEEDGDAPESHPADPAPREPETPPQEEPQIAADQELPTFLRRPLTDPTPEPKSDDAAAPSAPEAAPAPPPAPAPKPRVVDLPPLTAEEDIKASPGALSAALRGVKLSPEQAAEIAPLLTRLTALRDSMSAAPSLAAKD